MTQELAIATCGLTKQFDSLTAVHDVNLDIASGAVYGLIGPNGAGKTTLLQMLATVETPTIGEITIHGEPLFSNHPSPQIKRLIGYLPDDFPVYEELTVWDYLDYFARLYRLRQPHRDRRIRSVLELVQLTSKRHSAIASLSRGMKQRLSLARTILHEPVVLLLDEPVSGLDPIARLHFRDIIKALREVGMTIVISSHVLSDLAEICTMIGIMELGYLVESTSLSELYQRLSRQQIRLSTVGKIDDLVAELRHYPQVEYVESTSEPETICIGFSGNLQESSELLRSLIQAGIPLTQFHPLQEDLETIFLKLGHKQAS